MNKDEFEQRFDEALEQAARSTSLAPDPTSSWLKLQQRLSRIRRRKKRLAMLPYLAGSFLLGAFLFGSPLVATAFTPLYQKIVSIQDGVVSLIFRSDVDMGVTPATSPPPDGGTSVRTANAVVHAPVEYASWEAAAHHTLFEWLKLGQITEEVFRSEHTSLIFSDDSGKASTAILSYTDDQDRRFRIRITVMQQRQVITSPVPQQNSRLEMVQLANGNDAFLVVMDDGRASLEYLHGNLFISISGTLSEKQLIGIANTINSSD